MYTLYGRYSATCLGVAAFNHQLVYVAANKVRDKERFGFVSLNLEGK